jgi:hypothetical protein
MRTQKASPARLGLLALSAIFAIACASQSEGERCDRSNGDNDCESGLACVAGATLDGAAVCCPSGRPATTNLCRSLIAGGGGLSSTGGSGGSATDAGTGGTSTGGTSSTGGESTGGESSGDASPGTPADAGVDAQ